MSNLKKTPVRRPITKDVLLDYIAQMPETWLPDVMEACNLRVDAHLAQLQKEFAEQPRVVLA
jgi:hypothetical protein